MSVGQIFAKQQSVVSVDDADLGGAKSEDAELGGAELRGANQAAKNHREGRSANRREATIKALQMQTCRLQRN